MICPKCQAIVPEDVQFCPNCGSTIISDKDDSPPKSEKKSHKKRNIKVILIGIALIIIAVLIIILLSVFSGNKGEKIAESVADKLGRSIDMAEKNANIELLTYSENTVLKSIIDYDYIVEADDKVNIEGIHLPQWAVFVENDENDKIQKVTYYNFKILQNNWKGEKTKGVIDTNTIEYGMTFEEAQNLIAVKPLAITYSNDDITTYLYKYYYIDENDSNEKAYYLSIDYTINNTVSNVVSQENDYISFLLK